MPRLNRHVVRFALALWAAGAVVGIGLGLLWNAVSPRVQVQVTADGLQYDQNTLGNYISMDGWFCVLAAVAGIVLAIGAVVARRRADPWTLVALLVASALGTLLMWRVGLTVGGRGVSTIEALQKQPAGTQASGRLVLRSHAALLVWAITSTATLIAATVALPEPLPPDVDQLRDQGSGEKSVAGA